ncbi:MAG: TrmH family RNA methyltransferase [Saprospiraceae bacterium]
MNEKRLDKFQQVATRRQPDLTVVLENVIDLHNIGAVLRSCDSVGIAEIFVLHTEEGLKADFITIGRKTSGGSRRWVDVHYYTDAAACFAHVKQRYGRVLSTQLSETATPLYQLDLTQPTAFLFGNERDGLSSEAAAFADGNFVIPQMGMAESLNISVACAVTLYETFRQREVQGFYHTDRATDWHHTLFAEYVRRHEDQEVRDIVWAKR